MWLHSQLTIAMPLSRTLSRHHTNNSIWKNHIIAINYRDSLILLICSSLQAIYATALDDSRCGCPGSSLCRRGACSLPACLVPNSVGDCPFSIQWHVTAELFPRPHEDHSLSSYGSCLVHWQAEKLSHVLVGDDASGVSCWALCSSEVYIDDLCESKQNVLSRISLVE